MDTSEKITAILEKVRPYIQMHGGDVSLLEIREKTAILKFDGSCTSCPLLTITVNRMIKPLITGGIPEIENILFE